MWKLQIKEWMKFNRLSIVEEIFNKENVWRKKRFFTCKCECWKIHESSLDNLKSWMVKSCWCLSIEKAKQSIKIATKFLNRNTHSMSYTSIYKIYSWLISRCKNTSNSRYKNYWWRWILCEWNSFEEFYSDMWELYREWLSIERMNNNWNYCKKNCIWIERNKQQKNKQNTIFYNWFCLKEYCENNNLKYRTIWNRYRKLWFSLEEAINGRI